MQPSLPVPGNAVNFIMTSQLPGSIRYLQATLPLVNPFCWVIALKLRSLRVNLPYIPNLSQILQTIKDVQTYTMYEWVLREGFVEREGSLSHQYKQLFEISEKIPVVAKR